MGRRHRSTVKRDLLVLAGMAMIAGYLAFIVGGPRSSAQPDPPPPTERIDVELPVDFPYDI